MKTVDAARRGLLVLVSWVAIGGLDTASADHGGGTHIDYNLAVPATSSSGNYTVTWTSGYGVTLEEKLGSGAYSSVYVGTAGTKSFSGKGNGTYTYRVRLDICFYTCTTYYTEPESIVVTLDPNVPSPLTGPDDDDDGTFTLNWASIATATHYKLERRVDGGTWATILPNPTTTSHTETGLQDGEWEYRVSSCDSSACSSPTAPKAVDVATAPGTPGLITGPSDVSHNNPNYTLSWSAAPGSVTSYEFQESVNGSGSFVTIQNSAAQSRSFSGKPIGTYYYRVRACNVVGAYTNCGAWTQTKVVDVQVFNSVVVDSPATSVTGSYVVTWGASVGWNNLLQESANGGQWTTIFNDNGLVGSFSVSGRPDGTYRYRIFRWRTYLNSWGEQELEADTSTSTTTVVGQIPEPSITSNTVAGFQTYDAGVTKGGSAYVHVPIEAAPGVRGYQPRLALIYNSGRDRQRNDEDLPGDILGYGWSLGGIPAIRRCVKGQDNSNIVDLDTTDELCLGGEPLRLVSGAKWQPGSEYRTYRESFSKIVMHGTASDPWFKVYGADGSVSEYGNTPESSLRNIFYYTLNGVTHEIPTDPYLWSISRQEDVFGNEIEFEYYEDEAAGVRHPARIRYGNNFDAEIQFEYVSRDDLEPVSLGTASLKQNLLLHTIRTVLSTKTVREYRLDSETDPINDWRRLDRVQLCGYDENGVSAECLEPIDFDWAEPLDPLDDVKTFVERITDSNGRITEFD